MKYRDLFAEGEDILMPGHSACAGCAAVQTVRFATRAIGMPMIMTVVPSCMTGSLGRVPFSALRVPVLHMPFETAGAAGTGVSRALRKKGDYETVVLSLAGDGGTFDIGLQALSGAAERGEDFIHLCYDNEAYMNTGIQRSSATPPGTWTTTTPLEALKEGAKKDIVTIFEAHRIPYVATICPAFPDDLMMKVKKAKGMRGFRFLHAISPCPTGWRFPPEKTVEVGRLAVISRMFPLYEIENGRLRITVDLPPVPVGEYLRTQGRFAHLSEDDVGRIQDEVNEGWERLKARSG